MGRDKPAPEEHWGKRVYIAASRLKLIWFAGKNLVDWGLVDEKEYRVGFASRGIDECLRVRTYRSTRRPVVS